MQTDQQANSTPNAAVLSNNLAVSPSAQRPKGVSMRIINNSDMDRCQFWLGLFEKGKMSPNNLFSSETLFDLFETAATMGVSEAGPLMLSDSLHRPARFVYLLPEPAMNSDLHSWNQQIVETLGNWSPQSVGIYLSPSMLDKEVILQILHQVLSDLGKHDITSEFVILPGKQISTAVLNVVMKVKKELQQKGITCAVFH